MDINFGVVKDSKNRINCGVIGVIGERVVNEKTVNESKLNVEFPEVNYSKVMLTNKVEMLIMVMR